MPEKPTTHIAKAPEGQILPETPRTTAPSAQSQFFGAYGYWLGDPERRYGRMTSARNIPERVKLEMLRDPVIALAMGFIAATLVKAKRNVECMDEPKRLFFEAMFRTWEQEFILQAAQAVALGSCGLIKRFRFAIPQPQGIEDEPVWDSAATPYVVEGFDQCFPVTSTARFDPKGRTFLGITTSDGDVDAFFSLWITLGKARAFGAYAGSGRLENAYKDWWAKHFAHDLYLVWLQKQINPATKIYYPPGQTSSGASNADIAIATGDSVRSGATVAIPGDVYATVDSITGDERLSGMRKWALEFLESTRAVGEFHAIADQHDKKISLGMLIPSQAMQDVAGGDLGGPTSADKLSDLAEELLLMEAAELDRHLNEYVFPIVDRANFAPDSPRVRVRTVGLEPESRAQLFEIVKVLLGRLDVPGTTVDIVEALERLGIPVGEGDMQTPEETPIGEPVEESTEEASSIAAQAPEPGEGPKPGGEGPSREALQKIISVPLSPVPGQVAFTERDIEQAVARLRDVLPEIFEGKETA